MEQNLWDGQLGGVVRPPPPTPPPPLATGLETQREQTILLCITSSGVKLANPLGTSLGAHLFRPATPGPCIEHKHLKRTGEMDRPLSESADDRDTWRHVVAIFSIS